MRKDIFKIDFNGIIGTGVLLKQFKDGYGIIVTASHCMKNIQENNVYGQVYDTISFEFDIKTMYVCKLDQNKDIAVLIVKFQEMESTLEKEWTIPEEITDKISSATLYGFPCAKESERPGFSCHCKEIVYDENQDLYVGKLQNWFELDKTMLMQGMSGSPVYDEAGGRLYGIYLGSQENEFKYDECRIEPIQNVIKLARENNLIYYKKFAYNEGIGLYDKTNRYFLNKGGKICLNLNKYHDLSFLLIGKSGQGKSSFIKSFLKHSDQISSTGEGRTTRLNCEYKIYYSYDNEPKPNYIQVKFLNKDKFVALRLKQVEKKLKLLNDSCNNSQLYQTLCKITGFFEVGEFGKGLADKVDSVFKNIFLDSEDKIKAEVFVENSSQESNTNVKQLHTIYDYAEDFYKQIFDILEGENCFKNRKLELDKDLPDEDKEFLTKCFKNVHRGTERNKGEVITTYTGMIEKIEIQDRICDEYADLCEKLKIREITFVDTFGLDHQSHEDETQIEQRLKDLLNIDYPQIKNVLYIRKLSSDSPADLEYYLPALYRIDAAVVLNVVFTGADQNENFIKSYNEKLSVDLLEMNAKSENRNSAVSYFEKPEPKSRYDENTHPLQKSILNVVKSEKYAESMFSAIANRLTPYCASENKKEFQKYFYNNSMKLCALFNAVINKEYIGNGIIDVKKYKENLMNITPEEDNTICKVFDKLISQVFQKASMEWGYSNYHRGHWKTKQANYENIQKGKLGYLGVHDDRWASRFKDAYNEVFSTLSEEDFDILFLEQKSTRQGIAIQHLLNASKKEMLGCMKDGLDRFYTENVSCLECRKRDECFKYKLLEAYEEGILSKGIDEKEKDHAEWLNNRCNFEQKYQDNKEEYIKYFIKKFLSLEDKFHEHNEKIVTNLIEADENIMEAVKHIQNLMKNLPDDLKECADYIGEYIKKSIAESFINKVEIE